MWVLKDSWAWDTDASYRSDGRSAGAEWKALMGEWNIGTWIESAICYCGSQQEDLLMVTMGASATGCVISIARSCITFTNHVA
jgi:hypothetical protein